MQQTVSARPGEFEKLVLSLQAAGIAAFVSEDTGESVRWLVPPDSLFGSLSARDGRSLFRELVYWEDRPKWMEYWSAASASGERDACEFRIVRGDGTMRWLRATCAPLGPPGKQVLVVVQDVSDHRRLVAAVRESENRSRSLVQLSADWYWAQDETFRYVEVSSEVKKHTGLGPLNFLGKAPWEIEFAVADGEQWAEHRRALEAHRSFRDFEFQIIGKHGRRTWITTSGVPIFNEQKQFRGYRGLARDVTALKEAHASAAVARAAADVASRQLRDAIDALDDGFVLYDARDRLVTTNRRYRDIYSTSADLLYPGASFEEILREGVRRGQFPEATNNPEGWIAARFAAHRRGEAVIEQLTDKGRWLRTTERRTTDGGVVDITVDITELRLARERAEAANQAKSNFLAVMSHEVRTPLHAIAGFAELASTEARDPEMRENIEMIRDAGQRLLAIVNGILDFSKIEAGRMQLEFVEFDLIEAIRALVKSFEPQASAKGLLIRCVIGPDVPTLVRAARLALAQVITNLVSNAIKFTERGAVSLSVARAADSEQNRAWLDFTVRDTGIGIPAEKVKVVFEPFAQVDGTVTRRFGGTGLGLSISKRLVEMMGGRLSVTSEQGKGSEFRFSVPVTPLARPTPS